MSTYAAQTDAYRASSVMTASPEQLIVLLYDGAGRFLRQAEVAMGAGSWQAASERLDRGEAIVDELLSTLNLQAGEIAERLQAIYVFCKRCLIEARLERAPEKISHVVRLLADLRSAWAEVATG